MSRRACSNSPRVCGTFSLACRALDVDVPLSLSFCSQYAAGPSGGTKLAKKTAKPAAEKKTTAKKATAEKKAAPKKATTTEKPAAEEKEAKPKKAATSAKAKKAATKKVRSLTKTSPSSLGN